MLGWACGQPWQGWTVIVQVQPSETKIASSCNMAWACLRLAGRSVCSGMVQFGGVYWFEGFCALDALSGCVNAWKLGPHDKTVC